MKTQNKKEEIMFFDRFAATYSSYDVFNNYGKKRLQDIFQGSIIPLAGQRILDVGCGTGVCARLFSQPGAKTIGVDLSPVSIKKAKESSGQEYFICDGERLCFKDNSFDIVTFCAVLHHLPNIEKVIQEAFRVLKPGGKFFSCDPHRANPLMFLYRDRLSPIRSTKGITVNERLITKKELEQELKKYTNRYQLFCASGITYNYVASAIARHFLWFYNVLDYCLDKTWFSKYLGSWVFGVAEKEKAGWDAQGMAPPSLSVIVPARNEMFNLKKMIPSLAEELKAEKIPYQIIIVNDNSSDNTQAVAWEMSRIYPNIKVIIRNLPFGFGRALRDGFKEASGEVIIPFMADCSDDPKDLVRLYRKIQQGYDIVYGSRFMVNGSVYNYPPFKFILNRIANQLLKIIFRIPNSDITNAFKAIRREALISIMPLQANEFDITLEIPLKIRIKGLRQAYVPVSWRGRESGVSSLRIINLIKYYKQYMLTLKRLIALGIKEEFF